MGTFGIYIVYEYCLLWTNKVILLVSEEIISPIVFCSFNSKLRGKNYFRLDRLRLCSVIWVRFFLQIVYFGKTIFSQLISLNQ